MVSNNKNLLVALLIVGIVLIVLMAALFAFLVARELKKDASGSPLPSPSANEVSIIAETTSVANNGEFYQPVPFKIVNGTDKTVYYFSGCGIYLPEPYKVDSNGKPQRLEGWDTPRATCMAMPSRIPIEPNQESRQYFWGQDDYDNKLLPEGNYQVAVGFTYDPENDFPKEKAYSATIKITEANWNESDIKKLCDNQLENSPLTYLCYKKGY